jgi:hypothetical protein
MLANNDNYQSWMCDDLIIEIVYNSDDNTLLSIASTCKRLRKLVLEYYNSIPIVRLSSIHNLFMRMIPENLIKHINHKSNTILVESVTIQGFLRGLRDNDYGCWCVIKDQLQYIGNHQLVKFGKNHIHTTFRCICCKKLTDNAMYHPWIYYRDGNEKHPNDIIIEVMLACIRCVNDMDVYWRGTLVNYIKYNNIMNSMITHHEHRDIGHCVYRRRNHEYDNNMVLNDAEVYAHVIIESGVKTINKSIRV